MRSNDSHVDGERLRLHLLVLRCQAGDERAFAQLFDEFQAKTLGFLRGIVGDQDAAEDVQQEVWLSVYRNLSALANPEAFRTWLFRVTRHAALGWLRRMKRERELVVDTPVEELDVELLEGDGGTESFDAERLAEALGGLSPPHREVMLFRYTDELSYDEIAVVVGCTIGTVRSRLHYAKKSLEDALNARNIGESR